MQGRHDHEHDAASGRGPGLALGAFESGQVHVDLHAARLPRHGLQRSLGIPAGLQPRTLEKRRGQGGEHCSRPGRPSRGRRQDRHDHLDDAQPLCLRGRKTGGGRQRGQSSRSPRTASNGRMRGKNLDKFFATDGPPRYQYQLRCQLSGGARLKRLAIINDLQMALLACRK